jgi:hypothetical protein
MSKYSGLINKLWPGAAGAESRAIAESFVARFADMPMAADLVESYLKEGARVDAAIADGSMTQEEGRALFTADVLAEQGLAPHVVAEITSWANKTVDELATADTPPAEPDKPAAEPAESTPAPAPAQAQPAPGQATHKPFAGPSRETLQAEITKWQTAMRQPEGSEGWRSYWKGGGSQAYGEALRAMEALDAPPPAPAADAPGAAPGQGAA